MIDTISGNYEVTDRELAIVEEILRAHHIKYKGVEKHKNANDGDVLLTLLDDTKVLIEVKEEDYLSRFSKYGDIGIDLVSSFKFKNGVNPADWKGTKEGVLVWDFFKQIDQNGPSFKGGKITYSKSDLWLFFSAKPDGKVVYYSFFPGEFIKSEDFKKYLIFNNKFAVNNKPADQMSHSDSTNSAVFYINHKDPYLVANTFDIKNLKRKAPDGFSGDGLSGGGMEF
ncbi:MAG: hypothetical protein IJX17_01685 [Clostridia bacterium]|nr:hypothetical protein [Clostridia bacterium]